MRYFQAAMGYPRRMDDAYHVVSLSRMDMGHRVPLASRHPGAVMEMIPVLGVAGPGSWPMPSGIGPGLEPHTIVEGRLGQG